jgi:hypothetical protein
VPGKQSAGGIGLSRSLAARVWSVVVMTNNRNWSVGNACVHVNARYMGSGLRKLVAGTVGCHVQNTQLGLARIVAIVVVLFVPGHLGKSSPIVAGQCWAPSNLIRRYHCRHLTPGPSPLIPCTTARTPFGFPTFCANAGVLPRSSSPRQPGGQHPTLSSTPGDRPEGRDP